MIEIIIKKDFERNMFELSLHGIPTKELDNMRNKFNAEIEDKPIMEVDSKVEKAKLQQFGFHFGKKNKTKVVNR